MQSKTREYKTTMVQNACSKVAGFPEFFKRFQQNMSVAGKAESTIKNYGLSLANVALHFNRLPINLNIEELESYLYYVKKHSPNASDTFFKHTVFSLRFIFKMTGQTENLIRLPALKREYKLPVVLSKPEMVKMLNHPKELKHRVMIGLLYGCGLRCFELSNLKIADIDFDRLLVHVRQGKGKKDRYVPLGDSFAREVKAYIKIYCPDTWLLNSVYHKNIKGGVVCRYNNRSIQHQVKVAAKAAGILKRVSPHSLRHTFATHLLEDGLDILSIKDLLGHVKLQTTLIYLHVAQFTNKRKFSPIENLEGVRIVQGRQLLFDFKEH